MRRDIYLSLAVICGDGEVGTLGRLLKSVTERPDGPMVDEVVIAWNGKNDDALGAAINCRLVEGLAKTPGARATHEHGDVVITLLRQEWKKDFALARNESFAACRGEWIMWADADDVIASAADIESPDGLAAINAVEKTLGIPLTPPSTKGVSAQGSTLKSWLRSLPWQVNCVRAPYDYDIQDGKAVVRQVMRRVLRQSSAWVWRSPDGLHELPYPAGSVGMVVVDQPGLLNRHYPSRAPAERLARNRELVMKLQENGHADKYVDDRHAHDVATVHIAAGDWAAADTAIREAISRASDDEDVFRYRIMRASIAMTMGKMDPTALQEAYQCIALRPKSPEPYFLVSECFYLLGRWDSCIAYFELGCAQKVELTSVDFIYNRVAKPRAQAALAYCNLGEPEKAIPLAEAALREFPGDALNSRALIRARDEVARKKAIDGLFDAVEFSLARGALEGASTLLSQLEDLPHLHGSSSLARFTSLQAALRAKRQSRKENPPREVPPETPEVKDFLAALKVPSAIIKFYDTERGEPEDGVSVAAKINLMADQLIRLGEVPGGIIAAVRPLQHKEHFVFYAPHAVQMWDPYWPEHKGIGGSETAVVYVARELAARGYRVTLHCPAGGIAPRADQGVVWYGLSEFRPEALGSNAVLIACRAPWVLRNPDLTAPTYIWHQDNHYANAWSWNQEVERRSAGSLHVSRWAMRGLIAELDGDLGNYPEGHPRVKELAPKHHIIGNGVCPEWCLPADSPERDPLRVIFASEPTRGLGTLLNCWPRVLAAHPKAKLDVFGDFDVPLAVASISGMGMPAMHLVAEMKDKMKSFPSITWHKTVPQPKLTEAMLRAGVYAYPGGPMPEGYGVVLAQAAAAGMAVVFPNAGALPEVLPDHTFMVPEVTTEESAQRFLVALLDALKRGLTPDQRRLQSAAMREHHLWRRTTDRLLTAVGVRP